MSYSTLIRQGQTLVFNFICVLVILAVNFFVFVMYDFNSPNILLLELIPLVYFAISSLVTFYKAVTMQL